VKLLDSRPCCRVVAPASFGPK